MAEKKSKLVEIKTKQTLASVAAFIDSVPDEQKRKDSFAILEMMKKITGEQPEMWGGSIIGFGNIHLKYDSGRELDWMKIGFSPRAQNLTLYVLCNSPEQNELLKKLGRHKTGKGCLYINKISDVNIDVLKKVINYGYSRKGALYAQQS